MVDVEVKQEGPYDLPEIIAEETVKTAESLESQDRFLILVKKEQRANMLKLCKRKEKRYLLVTLCCLRSFSSSARSGDSATAGLPRLIFLGLVIAG